MLRSTRWIAVALICMAMLAACNILKGKAGEPIEGAAE